MHDRHDCGLFLALALGSILLGGVLVLYAWDRGLRLACRAVEVRHLLAWKRSRPEPSAN